MHDFTINRKLWEVAHRSSNDRLLTAPTASRVTGPAASHSVGNPSSNQCLPKVRFLIIGYARVSTQDQSPQLQLDTDRQRGEGRVDPAAIRAARETDPTGYLEASGFTVNHEGRHLSVRGGDGDEVFRVTRRDDGRWLWCDRSGAEGGDTLALVQAIEPGTGFRAAVARLCGAQLPTPQHPVAPPAHHLPRIPTPGPMAREQGRKYLRHRGISTESITYAEDTGMLRYADGAVLFVGYDRDGTARSATRRATAPTDPVQKRELRGSDKRYPPILPGSPRSVWVVEGGMDALALRDLALRAGKEAPTAVVSGGASVLSLFDRAEIQALLRSAVRVVIAGEHEKSAAAQERADRGHLRQAERVAEITGRTACIWTQKVGKDLAEFNFFQMRAS